MWTNLKSPINPAACLWPVGGNQSSLKEIIYTPHRKKLCDSPRTFLLGGDSEDPLYHCVTLKAVKNKREMGTPNPTIIIIECNQSTWQEASSCILTSEQTKPTGSYKIPHFYLVEFHIKSFTGRPQGTTTEWHARGEKHQLEWSNNFIASTCFLVTLKRNAAGCPFVLVDCPAGRLICDVKKNTDTKKSVPGRTLAAC